MRTEEINTGAKENLIDITSQVQEAVNSSGVQEGFCFIYVPHTTAGVTINENADPTVREDILLGLRTLIPDSLPFRHLEGNSSAHVKASLIGSSVGVIVENGQLTLGTWQGIFFCEFDGPRRRKFHVKVQSKM